MCILLIDVVPANIQQILNVQLLLCLTTDLSFDSLAIFKYINVLIRFRAAHVIFYKKKGKYFYRSPPPPTPRLSIYLAVKINVKDFQDHTTSHQFISRANRILAYNKLELKPVSAFYVVGISH